MLLCCCAEEPTELEMPAPQKLLDDHVVPQEVLGQATKRKDCYVFPVHLDRPQGASFGMDVSAAGKVCMVNMVEDVGLVAEWNRDFRAKGFEAETIQQFDRIMAINDENPPSGRAVLERLRDATGRITLLMQRPFTRKVTILKDHRHAPLGIEYIEGHGLLLLTKITEGVFREHNTTMASKHEIKVPGRIVGVNGKMGTAAELLSFMEEAEHDFEVELLSYD